MKLKDSIVSNGPVIPKELKDKFGIVASYALNKREAQLFEATLNCVVKELKKDNINLDELNRVSAIVTKDGELTLSMTDRDTIGTRFCLVVYAVERWRLKNYGDNQIMTIIAEELCHHYWNIEDEVEVKYKVYNTIKDAFPGTKFEQFYTI